MSEKGDRRRAGWWPPPVWLHGLCTMLTVFLTPLPIVMLWGYTTFGEPVALVQRAENLTARTPLAKVAPPLVAVATLAVAIMLGIVLPIKLIRRCPARCPGCGGRAFRQRKTKTDRKTGWMSFGHLKDSGGADEAWLIYTCACGHRQASGDLSLTDWVNDPWARVLSGTSVLWRLPLLVMMLFLVWIVMGIGGIVVFGIFVLAYGPIGVPLQVMVRLIRQDAPENQPTPWGLYAKVAGEYLMVVAAIVGVARGILLAPSVFSDTPPPDEGGNMLLAIIPWFDPMCGVVALYYGAACWLRDGARRLWLLWKAATLPVSQAADAGPGFALFRGTARGPAACACFYEYVSRIEDLFEEPPRLPGFRLEDDSGSIRVEPGPRPPQVHRSWAHLPLSIVMPRPVYAILCGRVARQLWPNRKLTLCEGDSLCVMGPVHAEGEGAGQDLVAGAPATLRPAMRVGPPVDLAPTGKPFEEVLGMLWPRWRHGTRAQQLVVSHTSRAGMVVRLAGASLRSLAAAAVWITAGATLVFLSAHLCMAR